MDIVKKVYVVSFGTCGTKCILQDTYLIFKRGNSATSFEVSNEHIFKIKLNLIQCTSTIILFMFNQSPMHGLIFLSCMY